MQISKQVKIVGVGIVFVVITITLIVLIDELDFVARWLRHIEPYKDNIEHIIYACLIVILILNVMRKLKALGFGKTVKTLKANFNGFGFEVEFSDREVAANMQCEESASGKGVLKEKLSIQIQHGCYASVWERKIISILSTELQLDFATNTVLRRGECRYIPDGFAVKNGRAYILEVKVAHGPRAIDGAIAQLKTFADMVQETKISRVTVILCVVTDHPTAYLAEKIKGVNLGEETEFILRVFSPEQLERIADVVS